MRLIETSQLELKEFFDSQLPKYAILSHCWGKEEVTYQDFLSGSNRDGDGWRKIVKCCEIACSNQLEWAWVDTCCIDKSSTAELSESINSMYRWYKQAEVCYAFLFDYSSVLEYPPKPIAAKTGSKPEAAGHPNTDTEKHAGKIFTSTSESPRLPEEDSIGSFPVISKTGNIDKHTKHGEQLDRLAVLHPKSESRNPTTNDTRVVKTEEVGQTSSVLKLITKNLAESRWFTRGWTLQELLAPRVLYFYDYVGVQYGSKKTLAKELAEITGIETQYLEGKRDISHASISCRMSWASKRETTRAEDIAYCLLGIFDINMPLLYGEGIGAFQRLQEEIIGQHEDQTIFAWTDAEDAERGSILARNPQCFWDGAYYVPLPNVTPPCRVTNIGLEVYFLRKRFTTNETSPFGAVVRLDLCCTDTRLKTDNNYPQAAVELTRTQDQTADQYYSPIPRYYRTQTDKIVGGYYRSAAPLFSKGGWRNSSYDSLYVRRLQYTSDDSTPTITPRVKFVKWWIYWAWLRLGISLVLLQLAFKSVDRDAVRLWALLTILLMVRRVRELVYLLLLIGISYIHHGDKVVLSTVCLLSAVGAFLLAVLPAFWEWI